MAQVRLLDRACSLRFLCRPGENAAHDPRGSLLAGRRPFRVVLARHVLRDAQYIGNVGYGASTRQNVGRQRVAEAAGVRVLHLALVEYRSQGALGHADHRAAAAHSVPQEIAGVARLAKPGAPRAGKKVPLQVPVQPSQPQPAKK